MSFGPPEAYKSDKAVADLVDDAILLAEDNSQQREDRWRANEKQYRSRHDLTRFKPARSQYPYDSDLSLPIAYEHVEGCKTQIALALSANKPMVKVDPRRRGDEERAWRYQWLLEDQFERDVEIRKHLAPWIGDMLIFDVKPIRIGWRVERRMEAVYALDLKTGEYKEAGEELVVRAGPTWEGKKPWEVRYDPWASSEDDARYAYERKVLTPEKLAEWVESSKGRPWKTSNVAKAMKLEDTVNLTDEWRTRQLTDTGAREGYKPSEHDKRLIQVIDYWEPNRNIVVAGEKGAWLTLLNDDNPFEHGRIPFIFLRFTEMDGYMEGLSALDMIGDLVHEANTRRNQRMENVKRGINRTRFYNKNLVDGRLLKSRPWGDVPVSGDPSKVVFVDQPGDVTGQAYEEFDRIIFEIEKVTGYNGALQSVPVDREPARGLAMRQAAAGSRFELIVEQTASALRRGVRLMHAMNKQFLRLPGQAEGVVRARGELQDWTYQDVMGDYDFEFTTDPNQASPFMHVQQLTNALSAIAPAAPQEFNWSAIARAIFRRLGYRDDADQFLTGSQRLEDLENQVFTRSGMFPPAQQDEDHATHIRAHSMLLESGAMAQLPPQKAQMALRVWQAHLSDHDRMQRKMLAQQAQEPQPT